MMVRLAMICALSSICMRTFRSMVESRKASPWLDVGKFLDFLGGQEVNTKECFTRR
jgi:hypothetical protein